LKKEIIGFGKKEKMCKVKIEQREKRIRCTIHFNRRDANERQVY